MLMYMHELIHGDLFHVAEEDLFVFFKGDDGEVKDYQEQLKQMLQDLAKEKEKDVEKPLPLMNQVQEWSTGLLFPLFCLIN